MLHKAGQSRPRVVGYQYSQSTRMSFGYRRQVNFGMFVRLILKVGLRDTGIILVQAPECALRPVRKDVLYAHRGL
jgi:glycosylphosphatidylinositol transamidase (GPIT) subunit GPI8